MIKTISKDLNKILKNSKASTISPSIAAHYKKDESYHPAKNPDIIAFPKNSNEVSAIHKYCYENEINIIPFGQGSGFEGGVIPQDKSNENEIGRPNLCLDMMKHMNNIVNVFPSPDRYAQVQAGVTREQLNDYIRDTGLWFPIDPGANATLGGMSSTSASGTNAVRYNTMKENVINMEVVLPNGEIIHTAGENRSTIKSSAGYNLTELFVGSEGTLGTICQSTLRLHPIADYLTAATCEFESIDEATATAENVLTLGIPVARMEFLDEVALRCVNSDLPPDQKLNLSAKTKAALFFELSSSSQNYLNEMIENIQWLAEENNAYNFSFSHELEERNKLWKARHRAYYSMIKEFQYGKNRLGYSTDVCVPITKVGHCIKESKEIVARSKYLNKCGGIIGHVGDGNFHVFFGVDTENQEELAELKDLADQIAYLALDNNGTMTGEHGIGLGKKHLLEKQVGSGSYQVMKLLKNSIDPKNLMNPGKIF